MKYILYNPKSGNGKAKEYADGLNTAGDEDVTVADITSIKNYAAFFEGIGENETVIL